MPPIHSNPAYTPLALAVAAAARVVVAARHCSFGQLVMGAYRQSSTLAGPIALLRRWLHDVSVRLRSLGFTLIDTRRQHGKPLCSAV